jgi:hypothetical protein
MDPPPPPNLTKHPYMISLEQRVSERSTGYVVFSLLNLEGSRFM